jgi:hypothetical protein
MPPSAFPNDISGGEGIRTPGTLASSAVFKTAAFDHSATPPSACVLNNLGCASGPPRTAARGKLRGIGVPLIDLRCTSNRDQREHHHLAGRQVELDALDRVPQWRQIVADVVPARDTSRSMALQSANDLVGHPGGSKPRCKRVPNGVLERDRFDTVGRRKLRSLQVTADVVRVPRGQLCGCWTIATATF